MKKLIVAVILAVVLTLTLATPAFADGGNGNMGGKNAGLGLWQGLSGAIRHIAWGWGNGNGVPAGWGIYVATNHAISNIMGGDPPGQPWWSSAP